MSQDALMTINEMVVALAQEHAQLQQKRSDQRYTWNKPVTLGQFDSTTSQFKSIIPAWGLDLSYQGAGLLVEREIAPGRILDMKVMDDNNTPVIVSVKILYRVHLLGAMYRIGCEFMY